MAGGPSHVDSFDYKPELYKHDGKTNAVKTKGRGGDHSELGARDARRFCRDHGLDRDEADFVDFLAARIPLAKQPG